MAKRNRVARLQTCIIVSFSGRAAWMRRESQKAARRNHPMARIANSPEQGAPPGRLGCSLVQGIRGTADEQLEDAPRLTTSGFKDKDLCRHKCASSIIWTALTLA